MADLFDLRVLYTKSDDVTLGAAIWPNPSRLTGEDALIQKIVLCLYTHPGENLSDPSFGAGMRDMVKDLTGADETEARNRIGGALRKALDDLTVDMSSDPRQRLVDLRLVSVTYDPESLAWIAAVDVETEANVTTISVGA